MGVVIRIDTSMARKIGRWHKFIKENYNKDMKKTEISRTLATYIAEPNKFEVKALKFLRRIKL